MYLSILIYSYMNAGRGRVGLLSSDNCCRCFSYLMVVAQPEEVVRVVVVRGVKNVSAFL